MRLLACTDSGALAVTRAARASAASSTVLPAIEVLPPRDRLEVRPGAERLVTGAGDHHRPHVGVVLRLLQRIPDGGADGPVDRVAGFRPVDGYDHHVAAMLDEGPRLAVTSFWGVGHRCSTIVALVWPPPSHIVCRP